jgi:hypothetical protein
MYSFLLHAHQKVDRVAYKHLSLLVGNDLKIPFSLLELLNYEGANGPDAARLKKGKSEPPWHFYQPGGHNQEFLKVITEHHGRLVKEIMSGNHEHAAFEAAWLAHALVDGLTPAHHYPYEKELAAIRRSDKGTRSGIGSHLLVHADTARESIKRSFKLIGPKGLLMTHTSFDAGASTIILSLNLSKALPDSSDIMLLKQTSFIATFERYAKQIEQLKMYERFIKRGWTQALARDMRREVAPRMVRSVTLAWYSALCEASSKNGLTNASN